MEMSPTIKEIAEALRQWHRLETAVSKDGENPHFRSKFASLDNTISTIRVPLSTCGLSFTQLPDGDGLTTILMHTSGEWIKATANLKLAKQDPQGQGSAITYMRRYALSAALGLVTEEDDDGNAASEPKRAVAPKTAPTAKDDDKQFLAKEEQEEVQKSHIRDYMDQLKELATPKNIYKLSGIEFKPENFTKIIEVLKARIESADPLSNELNKK